MCGPGRVGAAGEPQTSLRETQERNAGGDGGAASELGWGEGTVLHLPCQVACFYCCILHSCHKFLTAPEQTARAPATRLPLATRLPQPTTLLAASQRWLVPAWCVGSAPARRQAARRRGAGHQAALAPPARAWAPHSPGQHPTIACVRRQGLLLPRASPRRSPPLAAADCACLSRALVSCSSLLKLTKPPSWTRSRRGWACPWTI